VVIGTGAGGAACAYELAKRGRAVLLLEEGDYHDRRSFTGRARPMSRMMYRDKGSRWRSATWASPSGPAAASAAAR
jgi:choline dehydrogenase-like flavoprotein